MRAVLFLAVIAVFLVGCASRGETHVNTDTEHRETATLAGTVTIPATATTPALELPIDLKFERTWVEKAIADGASQTKTTVDTDAIVKQAVSAMVVAVKQLVPAASPFLPEAKSEPWITPEHAGGGLLALVTTAATAYATQKAAEAREQRKRADFHEQDATEGYAKADAANARAETYARQLPPDTKV